MADQSPERYRSQRDFRTSPEPSGSEQQAESNRPIFVIQEHDASTLHYDFRIEVKGVLKSWAVPKGPSTDPREKRLAIPTEDHPLAYADFEGTIPEDKYGGGTVIVWDAGWYENLQDDRSMAEAHKEGHITIWLHGKKLEGGYALIRTGQGEEDSPNWLLVKMDDDGVDARRKPVSTEPRSVVSGKAIEEMAEEPTHEGVPVVRNLLDRLTREEWAQMIEREEPVWRAPMLARLTHDPFSDPDWLFERKLDGERCLAIRNGGSVRLFNRNQQLLNNTYPELVAALRAQPEERFVVDGEIVAFRSNLTSFAQLQQRMRITDPAEARETGIAVYFYLFDLLHLDRWETTRLPLRTRKSLLKDALSFADPLRFMPHRNKEGLAYLADATDRGWEGLLAKRAGSSYSSGRSSDWLKFKCDNRHEFVIGGYTDPQGERERFGALLLGYYENGRLRYAGKVGTGFDEETLHRLGDRLERLATGESPFFDAEPDDGDVHWVRPELVSQVGFSEWTQHRRLRHPRYLGLREDKEPTEVTCP